MSHAEDENNAVQVCGHSGSVSRNHRGCHVPSPPDITCVLLFAAKPEGTSVPLARLAGVWAVALGIIWLLATTPGSRRNAATGLFTFNLGVAILFVSLGVGTTPHGFLLWPIEILHAVNAAALLPPV